jgi:hypothetical protein
MESIFFSSCYESGCRIKSGMTRRNPTLFSNYGTVSVGGSRGEGEEDGISDD